MQKAKIVAIGEHSQSLSGLSKASVTQQVELLHIAPFAQALEVLTTGGIDMVFADTTTVDLPNLFTALNEARVSLPVVAVGPAQPVQNAVKAIRLGAIEYLSTPMDKELLHNLLHKIKPSEDVGIIYGDPKTDELVRMAKQFAGSNATVLLRGESGTGKEVFSKFIHLNSPRKDAAFVSLNCAAIPENLLESELFGHEKGAFSGALQKRLGKFQLADKGTLLLDEISEMDLALQAKLLRAIQERVIDPVGAEKPVSVDIRLIATTNRQLEDYVAEGKFREDLYFRLNVVALDIPPLRERKGDIAPLATHFAAHYGQQNGLNKVDISAPALQKLENCYWKGNVRELENTIHRAILMMGDSAVMLPEHIVISPMSLRMMESQSSQTYTAATPATAPQPAAQTASRPAFNPAAGAYQAAASGYQSGGVGATRSAPMVGRTMQDVERELILDTLSYCHGNRSHAADILGISIRTLRNKLKEYEEAGTYAPQPGTETAGDSL